MVNINKPGLTNLQRRILRFFFIKNTSGLNQRNIAKALEVSPPAIKKALPELEKQSYLVSFQDEDSGRWEIRLNKENRRVMQLKRADNLEQIYESDLIEYLEHEFAGSSIILFGSYSRGDDTENSDIDIAIIGRKDKMLKLEKYEFALERKISIQCYESFDKIHKHLKENLCNGIVLSGGIEL
ncbi:MAG: nucleotidyltransferase domain-containing protein [Candidatus Woesearchaeota archaeon]